ncbi:hypothetical protein EVA_17827 [gut metagenome]|uniref:Uncharacterized protein n=1 Tax=gut metagenome TaxID=749906 RepID=J9FGQ0_9ZZZZ
MRLNLRTVSCAARRRRALTGTPHKPPRRSTIRAHRSPYRRPGRRPGDGEASRSESVGA